jgi:hypothetical protein
MDRTAQRLARRATVGGLTVPYIVDAERRPIDFKALDGEHVKRCATHRRCGICGGRIRGPLAFVGPDDGRRCFADPWMHESCARVAMQQCPFLAGRRDWREEEGRSDPMLQTYSEGMVLFRAQDGDAHRGPLGEWHFEARGLLERLEAAGA